ncbi:hypothetical protein NQ317_012113 [Molorchus minor]|uniref:DDE Tnp4 domain-containing protein n=1 Tax=Molorchus minor TaxID=1323400 RepID=A0ABQ9J2Y0_9CUCU|nr:hypothetical protein NQ317_012113 [Molorchus minor]
MWNDEDVVIVSAAFLVILRNERRLRRGRCQHRFWVRPSLRKRKVYSGSDLLTDLNSDDFNPLHNELRSDGSFKNFMRMSSADFETLIQKIGPSISKMDTNYRDAIPVQERLAVTLRFLASGDSFISLSYLFKIGRQTVSKIVSEVCDALITEFKENIKPLPGRAKPLEYVIVADDAFPLTTNIMKPYPGPHAKTSKERSFNYRLSRARRISENVFGILSSVFRVLRKPLLLQPEKAEKIVLACVHLHNFLRTSPGSNSYMPLGELDRENSSTGEIIEGLWRQDSEQLTSMLPLNRVGRKSSASAQEARNEFADYFLTEQGRVPWQDKYC